MSRTEDLRRSCTPPPCTSRHWLGGLPGTWPPEGMQQEGGPKAPWPGPIVGDSERPSSWPRRSTQTRWCQGPREPQAVTHQREKPEHDLLSRRACQSA